MQLTLSCHRAGVLLAKPENQNRGAGRTLSRYLKVNSLFMVTSTVAIISSVVKKPHVRQQDSILLGWIRITACKIHKAASFFITDKGKTLRMAPKWKSKEELE